MRFKAFITQTTTKAKSGVNKVSLTVKLYSKKNSIIDSINEMFDTLGKMTYYNSIGEGSETATDDIRNVINEITRLKNELEIVENEICEISARKKCAICHSEIPKDVRYCPHCGTEVKTEAGNGEPSDTEGFEATADKIDGADQK